MMTILDAIANLVEHPVLKLKETYVANNRANNMGDALEAYVKDLFAGTFSLPDGTRRLQKIEEAFSYLGNKNNPPDMMLRGGDATIPWIETSKARTRTKMKR